MSEQQQQDPLDVAAIDLMKVVNEKIESRLSWSRYLARLRNDVTLAQKRLDMALRMQNVCSATKARKPRSDKGKKREKTEAS